MRNPLTNRYGKGAIAVATGALLLFPAGAAYAGSGPAPSPSQRADTSTTAPSEKGNPNSKLARAAGVCDDAHEIGTKGVATRDGVQVASVKQFYSEKCEENYAYVWVWDQFRDGAAPYDVSLAVYDHDTDEYHGKKVAENTTDQEFWTEGTGTVSDCTSAVGSLRAEGDPLTSQAASSKRC
ncbi:hypothetical protein [Streptomyces sulphureus]|uniref:hypothetical protein n=1 Tax=Streptomyces sulphureus TaxID=47758 RepID=UPI00039C52D2|nr:hypothetical protein [Streptomyces sulphureus]